jgi:hypothetical protein
VPTFKLRHVLLVSGVAAAMIASSATAQAQQLEARTVAPPTPEHTAQGKLMLGVTGAVLLGLPYAASVWSAAASEREGDKWLYQPVVGPWAAIVDRGVCRTPGCRGNIGSDALPLAVNGLSQAAGFALIIIAVSTGSTRPESAPRAAAQNSPVELHIAPASYRGGGGLAAFGTF